MSIRTLQRDCSIAEALRTAHHPLTGEAPYNAPNSSLKEPSPAMAKSRDVDMGLVYEEDYFSPGIYFLARALPAALVLPLLMVHAIHLLLAPPILSSTLMLCLAYLLSIPSYFALGQVLRVVSEAREARRLGAIRVPIARGSFPGNIDIVQEIERGMKTDYCGVPAEDMCKKYGPVHSFKILWGHGG